MDVFCGRKEIKLHPGVVFSILNYFTRRENEAPVFGTLLGREKDVSIEISHCFPDVSIGEEEGEEGITPDEKCNKRFVQLYKQLASKRTTLGWYHVSKELSSDDDRLQAFFSKTTRDVNRDLLMMHVDPYFEQDVKLYVVSPLTLNQKVLGVTYVPIKWSYVSTPNEQLALRILVDGQEDLGDLDYLTQFRKSIERFVEIFVKHEEYIRDVVEGKIEGDEDIALAILNCLNILQINVDEGTIFKCFEEKVQDLLTMIYLAKFAKTQLQMFEKLMVKPKSKHKKRIDRRNRK